MSVVFRVSAIVTALSTLLAVVALSGCGQTGPLYLPVVPALPKPLPPENGAARPASTPVGSAPIGASAAVGASASAGASSATAQH